MLRYFSIALVILALAFACARVTVNTGSGEIDPSIFRVESQKESSVHKEQVEGD